MFAMRSVLLSGLLLSGCETDEPQPGEFSLLAAGESARPVVVVAGLMQDEATVAPLAQVLREAELDVSVFVPSDYGLGDINTYAEGLADTVSAVLARTGASEVDLVGHSEGGLTSRLYVKSRGDEAHVHTLISLGSPQQGTEGGLLSQVLRLAGCELWAPACRQMVAGSAFLRELNSGDPTPGSVRYVTVATLDDGVVQPVTRAAIPGAENLIMQTDCPERAVGHFGLLSDAWTHQVVLAVLDDGAPEGDCAAEPVGGAI